MSRESFLWGKILSSNFESKLHSWSGARYRLYRRHYHEAWRERGERHLRTLFGFVQVPSIKHSSRWTNFTSISSCSADGSKYFTWIGSPTHSQYQSCWCRNEKVLPAASITGSVFGEAVPVPVPGACLGEDSWNMIRGRAVVPQHVELEKSQGYVGLIETCKILTHPGHPHLFGQLLASEQENPRCLSSAS